MIKNFRLLNFTILFLIINAFPFLAVAEIEIRHIKPPKLDQVHLGEKILCHRPMRNGTPNMTIETIGDKIVANNYGHGGSGWTLGPGSASYVDNLLLKANNINKDTPITIIGAGALGLFTAHDLYEKSYKNITIIAEKLESLTSHNAGGLLAPVSMNNGPEFQKIINQIGFDAYKFYRDIAERRHLYFKKGAVVVPTYFANREDSGLEPYVEAKIIRPAKDVVLDFGNGTKREMVSYDDGIFIDTADMMDALNSYVKSKNIAIIQKKIKSFDEIGTKFIINCSGMGSKELSHDNSMISVQGHLVMLKDQEPQDLQYMALVYFGKGATKSGQAIQRSFYMFPKHRTNNKPNDIGVIGGTFIENATVETPNEEEFDIMLKGAKEFYGIK